MGKAKRDILAAVVLIVLLTTYAVMTNDNNLVLFPIHRDARAIGLKECAGCLQYGHRQIR